LSRESKINVIRYYNYDEDEDDELVKINDMIDEELDEAIYKISHNE